MFLWADWLLSVFSLMSDLRLRMVPLTFFSWLWVGCSLTLSDSLLSLVMVWLWLLFQVLFYEFEQQLLQFLLVENYGHDLCAHSTANNHQQHQNTTISKTYAEHISRQLKIIITKRIYTIKNLKLYSFLENNLQGEC